MAADLEPAKTLLNAGIGHAMMAQLRGDVGFDHVARYLAKAAKRVVAFQRLWPAVAHEVLQRPLTRLTMFTGAVSGCVLTVN